MIHSFDQTAQREGTASLKYDARLATFGREDVTPMWVADMDFAVAEPIAKALQARALHPIFGYSLAPESLYQSLMDWLLAKHAWQVKREWIVLTPGVVPSLNAVVAALTAENDGVIVQPPVYFPFFSAVSNQNRRLIQNTLLLDDDDVANLQYKMNLSDLNVCASEATMLMLCSPHNPVGRVWQKDELNTVLDIANKHDLIVLADEIHADLVYTNAQHHMLGQLAYDSAKSIVAFEDNCRVITAVSPSKTFNIPGLGLSALIVPNKVHRQAIESYLDKLGVSVTNPFNMLAFETAFREGGDWLNGLMAYLQTTRDEAVAYIQSGMPEISVLLPESTYLLWLDCRKLRLDDAALRRFFIEEAGVGLSPGSLFGSAGEGFMRMNIGMPKAEVMAALERLKSALQQRR
ncbi:MalY Bifunctional PLP-dependent enzyme with beta-cystathionase and maltose regulon repressor activities [Methylophilaceae bacterium]